MAPIIPTCRPLITPLRSAIAVAVLSLASSLVPALDAAHARVSAATPLSGASAACAEQTTEARTVERVASATLHKPPTP